MMAIECKHGHLARSCYTCELEEQIAALEAEVERLKQEVASLQQSRKAVQAFGPINPIPKIGPGATGWDLPEVRPIELDPRLVKELQEVMRKFRKDRKEVDGE